MAVSKILVLAALREKLRNVRKHRVRKRVLMVCRECRRFNDKMGEQLIASLPIYGVNPGRRSGKCVGPDYFGPLVIKHRHVHLKHFIFVLTV